MGRRVKLPEGVRIWVGWSHLFSSFEGLDDPAFRSMSLDINALDKKQQSVIAKLHRLSPAIFELSDKPVKQTRDEIKSLLSSIGDVAETGRRFWLKRCFLEVIEAVNATGRFDIPIPYLAAPMPDPPASPFVLEDEIRLAGIRPLIRAFHKSLGESSKLDPDAWWGRVLLSAMINGGLLKTSFLCALPDAVLDSEPQMRWFVLRPMAAGAPEAAVLPRRWFPDPCTRLLCARGRQDKYPSIPILDRSPYRQVYKLISAYARARGFANLMPKGIKELMRALKTRLHHHLPPWMVDFAIDRQVSVSLPEWSWNRLICPPTAFRVDLTERECLIPVARGAVSKNRDEGEDGEDQTQWPQQLRQLASLLHDGKVDLRKRICEWRESNANNLLPSVCLISEWVTDWLLTKGAGRKVKRFRTVYGMVNAIGGRLVGQLGRSDLLELESADAFVEIYQAALEDTVSTGARRRVANALRAFHEYLVAKRNVTAIDGNELFAVAGRVSNLVDANIISLDLFFRTLRWLRMEAVRLYGEDVAKELELIAVVGYCCGLRRSEAIGLTTEDIEAVDHIVNVKMAFETWIAVCPNSLRGLKTRAGHREVPVYLLAFEPELMKLLKWFRERKSQSVGGSTPLFPSFVRNGKVSDTDPRLDLITRALQHCADDSTLRFHHLRHSFASWLLFMLWLGEEENLSILPDWFLPTDHDKTRWKVAARLRKSLLGEAPTNRRTALQVSALMGHTGTDITFSTYIHLSDFIVGRVVRRLTPDLNHGTLASLSGYSSLYLRKLASVVKYEGRPEYKSASFVDEIADRVLREGQHKTPNVRARKVEFSSTTPVAMPTNQLERMLHIARAINDVGGSLAKISSIARRFGCEVSELRGWHAAYAALPPGILRLNGQGDVRESSQFVPIELPVGKALQLSAEVLSTFQRLSDVGDPPDSKPTWTRAKLFAIVEEFGRAWIAGSYLSVNTESVAKAKNWLWWIEKIGFRGGAKACHFASTGVSDKGGEIIKKYVPSALRQRDYWEETLGIEQIPDAGESVYSGIRGCVRIDVDVRVGDEEESAYRKVTALYGVRFVLAMKRVLG